MTIKPWLTALCMAITAVPLLAQPLPCDQFGDGAFCSDTLYLSYPLWRAQGATPDVPDLDNNGVVNILDFINQSRRDGTLKHGLLGQYYGLADGSEEQDIDWPNFAAMPYDPILIQPVPEFDDISNSRIFLNTTMRSNFGAVFTGWLWVPDTANYTFALSGEDGVRVYLDDILVAEVENTRSTTFNGPLQAGMLPIRIEQFTGTRTPLLSLSWESNGPTIGPGQKTIKADYFYHPSQELTDNQLTTPLLHFDPPTGRRVPGNQSQLDVNVFMVTPLVGAGLKVNGQTVPVANGGYYPRVNLQTGLNRFTFELDNGDGNTYKTDYTVYRDNEPISGGGLFVNAYAREHYNGTIPIPAELGLQPWSFTAHNSTQLIRGSGNRLVLNGIHYGGGSILELEGVINISNAGYYQFRINEGAALEINGARVASIWQDYPDQWEDRGLIYLDAGRHHYFLRTNESWSSPQIRVYWRFGPDPDSLGSETQVPDGIFSHSSRHHHSPPVPAPDAGERFNRIPNDLVAEYLFRPGNPLKDTSGYNNHLSPDPRFYAIPTGGIQLQTGLALFSAQAGPQVTQKIAVSQKFSLEVDFIMDEAIDDWNEYDLLSVTNVRGNYLGRLRLRNDQLRFTVSNDIGGSQTLTVDNVIREPGRYYVVATYDGINGRIYVNRTLQGDRMAMNMDLSLWNRTAHVNVGPRFRRSAETDTTNRALPGRIMTAAVYAVNLSESRQEHNMNIGRSMNPTGGVAPPPAVVTFPPAGTSAADLDQAYHVANRLTFGPNPETITDILSMGVNNWIAAQMNPAAIDDSALENLLESEFFFPLNDNNDLRAHMFMRMAYSKRQLLEIMTQFWENHFNTQLEKTQHQVEELAENSRFREHALGNFADLLMSSAAYYPMTRYLDNDTNIVGAPNENYAREIMELHTVGVNNGYTHDDIIEAARMFTGWSLSRGKFYFDAGRHDYGPKSAFGLNLPAGGGMTDGIAFIQHLTGLRNTADYICWKLCQLFIADDPPADVVTAAADTFEATHGDIAATLNTIFSHPRFLTDTAYRLNKTKTPLEFVISLTRATECFPVPSSMPRVIEDMGMPMLEYADPTGFPEEGVSWIDTNAMLSRFNYANSLAMNRGSGNFPQIDLKNLLQKYDATTAEEILDLFSAITTHGRESDDMRQLAMTWLTRDNPNFELTDELLDTRVRQVLSLYLRLPEMNKQ